MLGLDADGYKYFTRSIMGVWEILLTSIIHIRAVISDIAGIPARVHNTFFYCQFLKSSGSSDTQSIRQWTTNEPIAGLIRVVHRLDGPAD